MVTLMRKTLIRKNKVTIFTYTPQKCIFRKDFNIVHRLLKIPNFKLSSALVSPPLLPDILVLLYIQICLLRPFLMWRCQNKEFSVRETDESSADASIQLASEYSEGIQVSRYLRYTSEDCSEIPVSTGIQYSDLTVCPFPSLPLISLPYQYSGWWSSKEQAFHLA